MKKAIYFTVCLMLLWSVILYSNKKMKLYSLYTPSHEVFVVDFFLPSIQDDFDIILTMHEQTCPSAEFVQKGWNETTIQKVNVIIKAIENNWNDIFIFSDVDIQFFKPIETIIRILIEGKDMVIQKNCPNGAVCSGFFACRANEKTLSLWRDVYKQMCNDPKARDQVMLNRYLRKSDHKNLAWDYLPDSFFGGGTLTGKKWNVGDELPIPFDIVMHHANWTSGVNNKVRQLTYVRDVVTSRYK